MGTVPCVETFGQAPGAAVGTPTPPRGTHAAFGHDYGAASRTSGRAGLTQYDPRRSLPASLPTRRRRVRSLSCWVALLTLSACSVYRPLPLDARPGKHLAELSVPASTLLPGGLRTHVFDPSDGLDVTEIAMLAVTQSPELRVLRAQAKVGHAQAFAAGLLPDPVFGYSRDRPDAGQQGASTAYTRGLSWDVGNLVTLAARRTAGRRADEQVDLGLLWSEWQVIAQARLTFVQIQRGRELVVRLEAEVAALEPLAPHLKAALERGVVSFDVATTGLAAASDAARQLADARGSLATREQDLRDLLGLAAGEPLPLTGELDLAALDETSTAAALEQLPQRRPDLRALAAGYGAQEARVRAAILGQFPAVNVGVTRSHDNSGISSRGLALSISLPLFDANRGAIRIERATREQLHEEYAQRLLNARGEVARLLATQQIFASREAELAPFAATLAATAERASQAYARGATDWTVYLASRQSALAAAVELIAVRTSLAETRIALATLLAGDWTA